MKPKLFKLALLLCFFSLDTVAKDEVKPLIDPKTISKIKAIFNTQSNIKVKPFDSQLIEINLGAKTLFASPNGKYIFAGPVINTQNRTNIVDTKEKQYRANKIKHLPDNMQLRFPATTEAQHTITLFTDIDCGYCRRFHTQIPELNAKGISVNYIMLPRAGLNSKSFNKTVSVLCSDDPQKNMTLAMKNQFTSSQTCKNSVTEQLALANEFGISSTPTLILPDGTINIGLVNSEQLINLLN
ncbi:DsbC family protein [Pseudoalteromonas denitrificans]|uniref:Thiol:disulfide interchange protein n=1 Tax=Pseudoalteromonas denitrificans DSM 6059 TaxID=1123010 RepID=A0A1I1J2A9_9GAMM|nr:DsbC family protein [Pseudoalteromonas denitrificans]SFC42739.1 thiol:disulfide interchange protein DsbC [Pseudoalteromonas denitrificans DSM 6059]